MVSRNLALPCPGVTAPPIAQPLGAPPT